MRTLILRLAPIAAGICVLLTPLLTPAAAAASSTPAEIEASVNKGVAYLESVQQTDGGFEDWDLSALAAAHVAAANVKKTGAETDARTWYRKLVGNTETWPGKEPVVTDYERGALNAYAAGIDPARVSKTQNLIAQIASYYEPASTGYYVGSFNGTVFALMALADTKTEGGVQRVPQALLNKSIEVVEKNQHIDGGWTWEKAEGNETKLKAAAEPDMTGAAMAALCTAGVSKSEGVLVKAKEYLESDLKAESKGSGAFESEFHANTDSNAWAVSGLNACGINPQEEGFTTKEKHTPIEFLISQQLTGGGFRYQTSRSTVNEYSSQDAIRALAGAGFTATPPVPSGGLEQWFAESNFSTSKTVKSPLALIVNNGTSTLKVCSVSVAPAETTTTLETVLKTAEAGSTPKECVTGHKSESATKAITQINGSPSTPAPEWDVSIDGSVEEQAKTSRVIHLGDTIYLRLA
jgi:hypothetical protein